jgi:hypothetical protein
MPDVRDRKTAVSGQPAPAGVTTRCASQATILGVARSSAGGGS